MRLLIAESEPPAAREKRRAGTGRSMGETLQALLTELAPGAEVERTFPADGERPPADALASWDGVFLTGSPIHVYEDTPEVRREIAFMRDVFASGVPSFGSCAGMQVAVVAAGGRVRSMGYRREAGVTRRITPTDAGREHPLLAGRPPAWDASTVHSDEVDTLPDGATLLARNAETEVQAVEIRHGAGVFWGVQYHPEIPLDEIAAALRRDADDLVGAGLARTPGEVEHQAALLDALAREPGRRDLRWRLGVDDELALPGRRTLEIANFLAHLVEPPRAARGRA